ncbi:hypothetical protein E1B28_002004 [Marasmius oreades]|uniref:Glycoside hydrolase family 76 protein n=1 Tax=Marasmius oreades TaxID=181124 RepID=A0A9P8AGH5_9AGAR|nr:uncharacterized protein E1B28_002004 [Marasmius oreades]KAG7100230.1 hypothetical protein E1B28_002004 [Marasmius oreades]
MDLLGGVFEEFSPTSGEIGIGTSVAFLLLSALLAEATSNDTYIKAANQTFEFININSIEGETTFLGLEDNTTKACYNSTHKPSELWYPPAGDLIEGLTILGAVDSYFSKFVKEHIQSQTLLRQNQRPDGILDIGPNYIPGFPTGDPFLVRGLMTAYRRNVTPELSDYIKTFIDIQYNGLLNNTTYPGTNIYGGSWIGPPSRILDLANQTFAAMVLVQAIDLVPSPSPPSNVTSVNTSGSTSTKTGTIVGGVVGGVTFIAIVTGLILLFLHKRKQGHQGPTSILASSTPSVFITSYPPSTYGITPFILPEPWEMDVAPKPAKAIIFDPNIQPTADEPVDPENLIQGYSMADQLRVDEVTNHAEDDFESRFQAMSTAHMVRILNARLESETLPPTYQSQVGSCV